MLLARFFDHFKEDLMATNCMPAVPPGTGGYSECWAELLTTPETLPDSLIHTMDGLVEQTDPANWPRLQAAVSQTRAAGAPLNTNSSHESLALQVWLWEKDQNAKEDDSHPPLVAPKPDEEELVAPKSDEGGSTPQPPAAPESNAGGPAASQTAKCVGKIARLPRDLREDLNRRLQNEESPKDLVEWLNGLPEVQSLLTAEFGGRFITRQNLYDWRQYGFRDWQMRQSARDFLLNLDEEESGGRLACEQAVSGQPWEGRTTGCATAPAAQSLPLAGSVTEKLSLWVALRYAAAAQALPASDDKPEAELRRLREFCRDVVALRRADIGAGRLSLEHAWLAAEQAKTEAEQEKRFWEWTKRPEIEAKLFPKRDPDQIRREVVRMLDRELLGIRHPGDEPGEPDPAIMI